MTRSSRTSRPYAKEPLSGYRTAGLGKIDDDRHEFGYVAARGQIEPQPEPRYEEDRTRPLSVEVDAADKAADEAAVSNPAPSPAVDYPRHPGFQPAASHDDDVAQPARRRDPEQAWQMVREDLLQSLPRESYERFVERARVLAYEDGEFIIAVPDAITADWLNARLRQNLKRGLGRYLGRRSIDIVFRVQPQPVNDDAEIAALPLFGGSPIVAPHSTKEQPEGGSRQASIVNPDRRVGASVTQRVEFESDDLFEPHDGHGAPGRPSSRLQAEYTFDTFVVGDHNRLAHAAATAIVESPGKSFNPLFIYGGVGLGKTHLLHAIGNSAHRRNRQVLYRSSEQFTNELIEAIGNHSTDEFRARYRRVDVLLVDDIQFIGNKERTQEEFFHTFNHLYEAGSQIVLTSDRPPKALATLEVRLRSRFEGGLQTDIAPPDVETRVAILQRKATRLGMVVDKRVLMAVAERFDSNIRELEGALNQLNWQSQLAGIPLTYETALTIVDNLAPQRRPASPPDVIRVVANHFDVTPEALIGPSRKQPLAHIRQIVMYLLREENGLSLQQIGDELGKRDHSTVRYGTDRIVAQIQDDDRLRLEISKLREKIYTPLL